MGAGSHKLEHFSGHFFQMNQLVLQLFCKIHPVLQFEFFGAKVRGIQQRCRQRGSKLVRNASRHFAHGGQAVYPLAVF